MSKASYSKDEIRPKLFQILLKTHFMWRKIVLNPKTEKGGAMEGPHFSP